MYCHHCETDKNDNDFYHNKGKIIGYICKKCKIEKVKKYQKKYKPDRRQYLARYRYEKRLLISPNADVSS